MKDCKLKITEKQQKRKARQDEEEATVTVPKIATVTREVVDKQLSTLFPNGLDFEDNSTLMQKKQDNDI